MILHGDDLCFVELDSKMDDPHSKTIYPVAEIPRRVAYDPISKNFIVATWKKTKKESLTEIKLVSSQGSCQYAFSLAKSETIHALSSNANFC